VAVTRAAAKADPSGPGNAPPIGLNAEALERRWISVLRMEWSIHQFHRRQADRTLVLDRAFYPEVVWKAAKQARLVESVLVRLPLLPIHVTEDRDGVMRIIDGLQRLSAFFGFLEGKLILTGLRLLPELEGQRFGDLPVRLRRRFEDATMTVVVLQSDADPALAEELFERFNAGTSLDRRRPGREGR
jgi:hypothetical protein